MEKTFQLETKEQQILTGLEQDTLRLNARYGQLRREQDDIDKRLMASEQKQRSFIENALATRGVDKFDAAQILNNNQLVCRIADQPITIDGEAMKPVEKANGIATYDQN